MTLSFRGNYGLVFRMYNDGLAYRFTTKMKNDIVVVDEEADYTFSSDHMAFAPYVNSKKATFEEQFMNSFEQPYVHEPTHEAEQQAPDDPSAPGGTGRWQETLYHRGLT